VALFIMPLYPDSGKSAVVFRRLAANANLAVIGSLLLCCGICALAFVWVK
jgi:hypothetical protein